MPGSSVHGILQANRLEWVATPSSRGSSRPMHQTCISCASCIAGGFFAAEPLGKPHKHSVHTNKTKFWCLKKNSSVQWSWAELFWGKSRTRHPPPRCLLPPALRLENSPPWVLAQMSLHLPGCWWRTPASSPPGLPPARSSPRRCGPLLTPCPQLPGRLTGCVPEAVPSAATENRMVIRGLALGGAPSPLAGPGLLEGGGFPARPDDARGWTGRVTVPRLLPLILERPKGALRKPTLSGAAGPLPSQKMRRWFTFLGMGLPRRAHSSSACRPRWGWGREGSQMEAAAQELQVPGAAEDRSPGPHTLAPPWARTQQPSWQDAIQTWSHKQGVVRAASSGPQNSPASQFDQSCLQNTSTQGLWPLSLEAHESIWV